MRVASISLYSMSDYRLGKLSTKLNGANEVISTGNRINQLSDDPIGLTQVLNLKSRVDNLDQMDKNIGMGKTWLDGAETTLDSTIDLLSEVTTSCSQLINASATLQERTDAIAHVEGVMQKILGLGNVQVNGNYVFGGTKTDIPPLIYNDKEDPPNVNYAGDLRAFKIKTTDISTIEVGKVGKSVFWEETVAVDHSNSRIVFSEDTGIGENYIKTLTANIPDGEYTKSELARTLRNSLNAESASSGYGIDYTVSYDSTSNKYTIEENGDYSGYIKTDFKWETGGDARLDKLSTGGGILLDDVSLDFANPASLTIGSPEPAGTEPFSLTWKGDGTWRVNGNPGYLMRDNIEGTADQVEIDLSDDGLPDIILKLDKPAEVNGFVEFEMVKASGNHSLGPDLGFDAGDTSIAPLTSDNSAVLISIDNTNNEFDFVETDAAGVSTTLTATFPTGDYTDLSKLAQEIEMVMDVQSQASGNKIDYGVTYDEDRREFVITKEGANLNSLEFLWGANAATANALGFDAINETVSCGISDNEVWLTTITAGVNDMIDFAEINKDGDFHIEITNTDNMIYYREDPLGPAPAVPLSITIPVGTYSNFGDLATIIEIEMENQSPNEVDYDVRLDENNKVVISAINDKLDELQLLWAGGANNAASVLGFDAVDDVGSVSYEAENNPEIVEQHAVIPPGNYNNFDELALKIKETMQSNSLYAIEYDVFFDSNVNQFVIQSNDNDLGELELLWGTGENRPVADGGTGLSAGEALGFNIGVGAVNDDVGLVSYASDNEVPSNMEIIAGINDKINFKEVNANGIVTNEMTITLDAKNYSVPAKLALEIEEKLEAESVVSGNSVDYKVEYDSTLSKFTIEQNGDKLNGFRLLWGSGSDNAQNAARVLGFNTNPAPLPPAPPFPAPLPSDDVYINLAKSDHQVKLFDISALNNTIDFKELKGGENGLEFCELTAVIPDGNYTSGADLAAAIETAMEFESDEAGYKVDYEVSWNKVESKFSIKEAGTELDGLQLLWNTGTNKANSAASVLGFNSDADDVYVPYESNREVEWGVFNTLLDMKQYLANNDVDGLVRTMTRLEQHYAHIDSVQADNGIKYNRLEIQTKISDDVGLTLTTRRANLEEADYIEAVMDLKSTELAYEASLSSTSKILKISLMDYM